MSLVEQAIAAAFEAELVGNAGLPPEQRAEALARIAVEVVVAYLSGSGSTT